MMTERPISLPLIAGRNVGVVEAAQDSLRQLRENKTPAAVWTAVAAALIGLAILSRLMLMPFVFPPIAYATWDRYRQLSLP